MNGNLTEWYAMNNLNNNVLGVGTFIQTMNNYVNGWLGYGFLLIIFLTTFGFSMISGTKKALMVSSFMTFIFSIYFLRMSMINPVVVFVLIVLTIIGALGSKNEGSY